VLAPDQFFLNPLLACQRQFTATTTVFYKLSCDKKGKNRGQGAADGWDGKCCRPTAWLDWTKNFCGQFGLIRNNLFAVSATQVSWQVSKGF